MMNLNKMLFYFTLIAGTLLTTSSSTWLGIWMGLEINLLSIIPLINKSLNPLSTESSIKYFLTQVLASSVILFTIILMLKSDSWWNQSLYPLMMGTALLTKIGAAPFHFWFPEVMEGLSWMNSLLILTWQKIAPMVTLLYINIHMTLVVSVIISSMVISGIMGINQTSLRKIMAFSSINHIGWMLGAMIHSELVWVYYFSIYSIITAAIVWVFQVMNVFYLKQLFSKMSGTPTVKMTFMLNFLSLGGLPPFLGFFPKWITIQTLTLNSLFVLVVIMTIFTLVPLYFYMRVTFSSLLINMNEVNFLNKTQTPTFLPLMINFTLICSLGICTVLFNFN